MLVGGVVPIYCLPILKRERDRRALLAAAASGSPKFFLGTDSAPHPVGAKRVRVAAPVARPEMPLSLYAEAFDNAGRLDRLEGFCVITAAFYRLPRNTGEVHLVKTPSNVPQFCAFGTEKVVPFRAGSTVAGALAERLDAIAVDAPRQNQQVPYQSV